MHPTTRRTLFRAAGALLTLSIAPAAASAQQALAAVHVSAPVNDRARADELYERAMALPTETRFARKAAALYEQSAALRAAGDERAAASLRMAAYLRYYAGDRRAGVALMERAADHSAGTGDVVHAANAYIDAAIIAGELSDGARARELRQRAELLAGSPLLAESDRSAIRTRIAQWRDVAVAESR